MAWKFKKYKIKWNGDKRKFVKKKRDRKKSYDAHRRWKMNKAKMKMSLRTSKFKRKRTMRINKSKGIYKKLKVARDRYKHLLAADVNVGVFFDDMLLESQAEIIEIDLNHSDIPEFKSILRDLRKNIELEDAQEKEQFDEYIKLALERLNEFESIDDLMPEDEDFLEDLVSFIEEYGEEIGVLKDDDK